MACSGALGWILPSESTERVVYGVILVGALLAAESGVHETYPDTVLSAVIATAIYWLAQRMPNCSRIGWRRTSA